MIDLKEPFLFLGGPGAYVHGQKWCRHYVRYLFILHRRSLAMSSADFAGQTVIRCAVTIPIQCASHMQIRLAQHRERED